MAIAAVAVTAGTANAAPAVADPAVRGADHAVDYRAALTKTGAVATTLTNGAFALTPDGKAITVSDGSGRVIESFPTTFEFHNVAKGVDGKSVATMSSISTDGHTLTLIPSGVIKNVDQPLSSQQRFINELQRAAPGAGIGAIIGALIGIPLFLAVPEGAAVGAVIGLLVAGGQPLIDAGTAFFTGQP
ncbi:hypothetical protein FOS14_03675 [Skermania sp. ID1734]|uniref:hypothetical protein n=1 Tax=Skermania sp. ID1734 TaxID=2597516 RepID=UPI00117D8137|nr:hypothetical protein [Skermania sp. ID1734]TSE01637.1 hypothetical protein FOS14_03675 [Skermania sp. ID1734]